MEKKINFKEIIRKDWVQTVVTSLLCVLVGLLIGLFILVLIKPTQAGKGFATMVLNFLKVDTPNAVLKRSLKIKFFATTIIKFTPLLVAGLSILFAYKAGLFNIGCSGQYTMGILATLYPALVWGCPWYICIILGILAGAIWGSIVGLFKAYLNVNEVISGIMLNWIGLYLTNMILKGNEKCWDSIKYETRGLKFNAPSAKLPSLGLDKLFNDNEYMTIGFIVAIIVAVVLHIILNKTTFGYEIKATGANKDAAKYAGMREKKNLVITLAISGALAGLSAGLFYLTDVEPYYCPTSVPAMGFNGISAAFLGGLSPIGTIISSFFITSITEGGKRLDTSFFNPEIADVITSFIIYLCAFVFFAKEKINRALLKSDRLDQQKKQEGGNK